MPSDQVPEWAREKARQLLDNLAQIIEYDPDEDRVITTPECERLVARALCPPKDCVRLPDGRDVQLSDRIMLDLDGLDEARAAVDAAKEKA